MLPPATAGGAASQLIQNLGVTSAVTLLIYFFITKAQVSTAALRIPNIQVKSPVLQAHAELRIVYFKEVYLRLYVCTFFYSLVLVLSHFRNNWVSPRVQLQKVLFCFVFK